MSRHSCLFFRPIRPAAGRPRLRRVGTSPGHDRSGRALRHRSTGSKNRASPVHSKRRRRPPHRVRPDGRTCLAQAGSDRRPASRSGQGTAARVYRRAIVRSIARCGRTGVRGGSGRSGYPEPAACGLKNPPRREADGLPSRVAVVSGAVAAIAASALEGRRLAHMPAQMAGLTEGLPGRAVARGTLNQPETRAGTARSRPCRPRA